MKGTALITGGARRIGKAITLKLSEMGFNIALHYNSSRESALSMASHIKETGVDVELFPCDLTIESNIEPFFQNVIKHFGTFDLLVNNASIFKKSPLIDTSFETFNQNFNINFKVPYFLSQLFARHCQTGQIINIVDAKISRIDTSYSAYTLSKMALANFTTISAKELSPSIRVNAIAPGYIIPPDEESGEYLTKRPESIPLKRKGEVEEILKGLEFLIENHFVTGQILFIDGGDHLI